MFQIFLSWNSLLHEWMYSVRRINALFGVQVFRSILSYNSSFPRAIMPILPILLTMWAIYFNKYMKRLQMKAPRQRLLIRKARQTYKDFIYLSNEFDANSTLPSSDCWKSYFAGNGHNSSRNHPCMNKVLIFQLPDFVWSNSFFMSVRIKDLFNNCARVRW